MLTAVEPYQTELDFSNTRDLVIKSEELGFESVWINDHLNLSGKTMNYGVVTPQSGYRIRPSVYECWTLLSALAMVTEKVRLGTLVLCNSFRNPAVLAKMAATFDMVSGGRLDFGIGGGWHRTEFEQYGIPFGPFKERFQMLKEGLDVIKTLWTQDVSNYEGQYYTLSDAEFEPKPLQKPHPPIVIGAMGEKMLRLIADAADGWNAFFSSPEIVAEKCAFLEDCCMEVGRDPASIEKSIHIHVIISEDRDKVEEEVKQFTTDTSRELFRDAFLVGTPDEITEKVERFEEAGLDLLQVLFLDAPSSKGMELFAREVMPEFI